MPRHVLQTITVIALVAAIFFVGHNFVRYVLRVDGDYSEWSIFSECTASCGTGTRFRTRTCSNPLPKFGGLNCSLRGEDNQIFKCNMLPCPVDGGYGAWTGFSECSVTCGGGEQKRERRCDNPAPLFGGNTCEQMELGPSFETRACNAQKCPVNGGYGPWQAYSDCSVTCGGGVQQRKRKCDKPAPLFDGKTCEEQGMGASVESQACNENACPTDGGYTEWGEYGECSVTCGGGSRTRTRSCTNPEPANGGKNCEGLGPAEETQECNTEACPVEAADDKSKKNKKDDQKDEKEEEKKGDEEGEKEAKEEDAKEEKPNDN